MVAGRQLACGYGVFTRNMLVGTFFGAAKSLNLMSWELARRDL